MRVLIKVKKNILDRVIIDNQIVLISYPYYFYLDIKKFDPKFRKSLRQTRIFNPYSDKIN